MAAFIFPLAFFASFFSSAKDIFNGKHQGIFVFLVFGLSVYSTAMSASFLLGLKSLIPFAQFLKEMLVLVVFVLNVLNLKTYPKFNNIDYALYAFLGYTLIYAFLPIGEQPLINRLIALKSTAFFVVVYLTGRLINFQEIYVNKFFKYIVWLTVTAGLVVVFEVITDRHLQASTGYADFSYYFFNFEPSGNFGLSWTFESEGGYKRFASFFANPLEHAGATVLALAIIASLYTTDNNKLRLDGSGILAIGASAISIFFAISRAPLAGYLLIIYFYALITKKRIVTNAVHLIVLLVTLYFIYLFTRFEDNRTGVIEVIMNTVDFSNPSSVGHLVEWVQGIIAIINNPLGLGLGTSGRVGGSLGENIGGENQFIIIGVQTGVIALLLYLYVHIQFIKKGFKWVSVLKGKERKICMAVLLLKIGLSIPLFTSEVESSTYISYMNWFLSGLFVNVIMQHRSPKALPAYDY